MDGVRLIFCALGVSAFWATGALAQSSDIHIDFSELKTPDVIGNYQKSYEEGRKIAANRVAQAAKARQNADAQSELEATQAALAQAQAQLKEDALQRSLERSARLGASASKGQCDQVKAISLEDLNDPHEDMLVAMARYFCPPAPEGH
jgi:hypothetical protein